MTAAEDYLGAYPPGPDCTCGTPDVRYGHEPGCHDEDRRITRDDRIRGIDSVICHHHEWSLLREGDPAGRRPGTYGCGTCEEPGRCRRHRAALAMLDKLGVDHPIPF